MEDCSSQPPVGHSPFQRGLNLFLYIHGHAHINQIQIGPTFEAMTPKRKSSTASVDKATQSKRTEMEQVVNCSAVEHVDILQ